MSIANMTFEEADAYLSAFHDQIQHAHQIYVYDEVNGVYGKYRLAELSHEKQLLQIQGFVKRRKIPLRVVK